MPELPDVEVFKRYLDSTALHQEIEKVHVLDGGDVLEDLSPQRLRDTLAGRELASTRRHGKWLFASTGGDGDAPWLVLHFGMTGFLRYYEHEDKAPEHVRLLLDFADGYHLAYDDQRKLGQVRLVDSPDDFIEERGLGPDAAAIERETFRERVGERHGAIKSVLMNQEVLAGIGNEYSDEILFQARIHPQTKAGDLTPDQLDELHAKMGEVLRAAIDAGVDRERFPESFLDRRREKGAPCPGCGGEIATVEVSGRTAYYCPKCQSRNGSS